MRDEVPTEPDPEEQPAEPEILLPQELINAIPEERREEFRDKLGRYFLEIRREEHYSGPLMPYREASGWDALVPGAAARSFSIFEQQSLKQIESREKILDIVDYKVRSDAEIEKKQHEDMLALAESVTKSNADIVKRGQFIGAFGALLLGAGGFLLIYLGHSGWGVAIFVAELVGFVAVFAIDNRISPRLPDSTVEPPPSADAQLP